MIDVTAGIGFALELAQAHGGLAELDALPLLRLQRPIQRGFKVAGARQIVLGGLGEAVDLLFEFGEGAAKTVVGWRRRGEGEAGS